MSKLRAILLYFSAILPSFSYYPSTIPPLSLHYPFAILSPSFCYLSFILSLPLPAAHARAGYLNPSTTTTTRCSCPGLWWSGVASQSP